MRAAASAITVELPELLALRATAQQMTLPSARLAVRQQQGRHRSRLRGRGLEFSEVRTYQAGDDIRTIDWRVTARRQQPHTKLFHEERERPVFLVCDQRHSLFFGSRTRYKSVQVARVVALLSWLAWRSGDRLGGLVFGDNTLETHRPDQRRRALLGWLQQVAQFNGQLRTTPAATKSRVSLEQVLAEACRVVRPGSLVVLCSDFHDLKADTAAPLLHRLRRHGDVIALRVLDPLERALPDAGWLALEDDGKTLAVGSHNAKVRTAYANACIARDAALQQLLNGLGIPLVDTDASDDADQCVARLLQVAGRR